MPLLSMPLECPLPQNQKTNTHNSTHEPYGCPSGAGIYLVVVAPRWCKGSSLQVSQGLRDLLLLLLQHINHKTTTTTTAAAASDGQHHRHHHSSTRVMHDDHYSPPCPAHHHHSHQPGIKLAPSPSSPVHGWYQSTTVVAAVLLDLRVYDTMQLSRVSS